MTAQPDSWMSDFSATATAGYAQVNVYNALVIHGILALGVRRTVQEIPRFHARIRYRINDVELSSDGAGTILTIVDDGRGFAAGSAECAGGLGIAGMRERLRLVGGRLQIDSRSGAGTTVVARVPLPPARDVG